MVKRHYKNDENPSETEQSDMQTDAQVDAMDLDESQEHFDKDGNKVAKSEGGLKVDDSKTVEDMKGTITDPVSFSNPAFDPSRDAATIGLKGNQELPADFVHEFKGGHFYKKGDVVQYRGVSFEALADQNGDVAPSLWAPSSKTST
jgi:hypothetical protein